MLVVLNDIHHIAAFEIDCCSNCPKKDKCPVKAGGKHYYLRRKDKFR